MAEVLNAPVENLDSLRERNNKKSSADADPGSSSPQPAAPLSRRDRDRDSRERRNDRDYDRPPRREYYDRNRSPPPPPPRERDYHKRGRPSPSPPPPPYRDRRGGGHSPPSRRSPPFPPYKRSRRDDAYDGRRGSASGGYGPGNRSFYCAGLDMIILVGMIERWVVDLVILMNGLMVSTWVGHLEATEVVHLIGILVMTVLLMLPTPRAPKVNSFSREGMMSYKQFIQELEDDILPSEAERRYQEYKSEYISTQKRSYFSAHKDEEWLKDKYHPTNLLAVIERRNELAQKLAKDFQLDLQSRTLDLGPAVNPSSNKSEQSSEPNSEDETDMGSKRRRHGRGSAEESAAPKAHPVSSEPRRIQIDVEQAQALVRKLDSEKGIEDNKLCRVDNDRSSRDKSHSGSSRPVIIIRGSTAVKGLEGVELLETLLTYLWRIHGVDYYGMVERNEAKGLRHVRVDAKNFDTGGNGSEWEKKLDSYWQERLKSLDPLEVMTAKEKIDAAATEALDPYVRKIRDEKYGWKYGCGAKGCTKLFHASEFVHKHLKLKHTDLVMELTSKVREELYFQNYINDENAPGGTPIMQPTILKEKPQRCMPGPGNRITDERGSRRERNNRANGSEQFDMLENPLSRDFPSNNDGALGNNPDEPMFDTFGGQGIPIAPFPSDIPPPVLMPVPGAGPLGPFVPAPPEVAMRMFRDQGGPSPYDVGRNGRSGPQVSAPAPIIALPPFRQDPRHLRSYNDLDAPEDEVTVIDYRSL
ncbi:serrate RNA effector molecule-like isoform X4 [Olea europaea var. sylvestris]|uniref:serrate RNA effector molecule-like isoform X4 n=1 Tax=Olea europaea var. sylvestris TaxID=158386 RepID=UPI000C1D1828|nr:serrate RNA effector molecule-like isoform X4 [Olea europaea var. sylvestris]